MGGFYFFGSSILAFLLGLSLLSFGVYNFGSFLLKLKSKQLLWKLFFVYSSH
ncbi:Uncharacterised protein [Bacillus subtilis]|nr:hypothetical protein S101392_00204 [Bacillus subtilis subsp. subtilis]CJS85206.1 Uncharacterised protein [Streptococcus pneumoniae]COO40418.1 Uncharacterised protein [Bacillus subtilis]